MNLVLKRFSQDVDLLNGGLKLNFLVFDHDGEEVRFPVPEETALAVMTYMTKHLGGASAPAPQVEAAEVEEDEDLTEATQFGGDEEEFEQAEEPQHELEEDDEGPASEDEVPSL